LIASFSNFAAMNNLVLERMKLKENL